MLPSVTRHCVTLARVNPSWILTTLRTSFVILLGLTTVSCHECNNRELFSIQEPCQKQNDDLVTHLGTNHTHKLCSALTELLYCTAKYVPACIHNMTEIYQHLTHSPHNCRISQETFLKIQNIIHEAEKARRRSTTVNPKVSLGTQSMVSPEDETVAKGDHAGHTANAGSSHRWVNPVGYFLLCLLVTVFELPVV